MDTPKCPEEPPPIPDGFIEIDDYIAKLTQDPVQAERLDRARIRIRARLAQFLRKKRSSRINRLSPNAPTGLRARIAVYGNLPYILAIHMRS